MKPQVQWLKVHCIGCHTCIEICPQHMLSAQADGIERDRSACIVCGTCVEECPSNAMEMLGKHISADALVSELLKDRAYFEKSGGGVTLSGGEPTLQPAFTLDVLQKLKAQGIQTALDTCGLCLQKTLKELLPWVDILLFDLKLADSGLHREWTGSGNKIILENLKWVCDQIGELYPDLNLWIRTPLIPRATDSRENITYIGELLAEFGDEVIERWELCAFNNLGRDKYERLGLDWQFADESLMTRTQLDDALYWAKDGYKHPERVFVTGSSRLETD